MPEARKYQDRPREENSVELGGEGQVEGEAQGRVEGQMEGEGRPHAHAVSEDPWGSESAEGMGKDKKLQGSREDEMDRDLECGITR